MHEMPNLNFMDFMPSGATTAFSALDTRSPELKQHSYFNKPKCVNYSGKESLLANTAKKLPSCTIDVDAEMNEPLGTLLSIMSSFSVGKGSF